MRHWALPVYCAQRPSPDALGIAFFCPYKPVFCRGPVNMRAHARTCAHVHWESKGGTIRLRKAPQGPRVLPVSFAHTPNAGRRARKVPPPRVRGGLRGVDNEGQGTPVLKAGGRPSQNGPKNGRVKKPSIQTSRGRGKNFIWKVPPRRFKTKTVPGDFWPKKKAGSKSRRPRKRTRTCAHRRTKKWALPGLYPGRGSPDPKMASVGQNGRFRGVFARPPTTRQK